MMRDGERHARGQKDQRVERGHTEGRNDVKASVGTRAQVSGAIGRPAGGVVRPQHQLVEYLGAFATDPWHRELSGVEQCAEERGEEHHFREDEPDHAHAERTVHRQVVHAILVLADNGVEPAEEHERQQQESRQQRDRARPFI